MIFPWFKRRRRRKLREAPLPGGWLELVERGLPFYSALTGDERTRFLGDLRVFAEEKHWEGCRGQEITDEVRVLVSGQACRLVLGLDISRLDMVHTILVYPDEFFIERREVSDNGVIHDDELSRIGEAWSRGPVVLSWADVQRACRRPGTGVNVVLHELAHQLDMAHGGDPNGTPRLPGAAAYRRWHEVMEAEFRQLRRRSAMGLATLMDRYGAEHPAEFFAVATENFFERPPAMAQRHPRLYALLAEFYGQDPAAPVRGA